MKLGKCQATDPVLKLSFRGSFAKSDPQKERKDRWDAVLLLQLHFYSEDTNWKDQSCQVFRREGRRKPCGMSGDYLGAGVWGLTTRSAALEPPVMAGYEKRAGYCRDAPAVRPLATAAMPTVPPATPQAPAKIPRRAKGQR